MVVVHLANLMEPIALGSIESLVRRATRSLTMTSHSALARCLATTTLMSQKDGRTICIIRINIVKQLLVLAAMMDNAGWLSRVIRLLLIVLFQSDFGQTLARWYGVLRRRDPS